MTADDRRTLTERQVAAARSLAHRGSYSDAARAAGVSTRTLRRWRQSDEFTAALRAESRAAADDARQVVLALQLRAVRTLRDAMGDDNAHVRVRAARAVLEVAARVWAEAEISDRLDALEEVTGRWAS